MSNHTLARRLPAALLLGACVAVAGVGFAVADRTSAKADTFQPTQAMTYVLGSKRAVGYFERANGTCRVTLMIAEEVNTDVAEPTSAARLRVSLTPGQGATLGSAEGESIAVTCGAGAETVDVVRGSPARS